jgi:hypothetical protein
LVLVLWAGMMSIVDASPRSRVLRFLRRWVPLPIPFTGTGTHTGTAGTGTGRTGGAGTSGSIPVSGEPTAGGAKET